MFRGALTPTPHHQRGDEPGRGARRSPAVIGEDELHEEYIIPSVFNKAVVELVAAAVAESAVATGVAQKHASGAFDIADLYR